MPRPTQTAIASGPILLGAWPQQVLRGCCGSDPRQTVCGEWPCPRSQAVGQDRRSRRAVGPGRAGLGHACAVLPSGAEPALMKWASLRLALISRLGGHLPAGKCHQRQQPGTWRGRSPGQAAGGAVDACGMLMPAKTQTL